MVKRAYSCRLVPHGCGMLRGVKLPIVGVRQIKLPVSDLARSARWYSDLFGLELAAEFYEDSAVRGIVLADHAASFVIGLRQREYCASGPVLDGFDVCAFMADPDGTILRFVAGSHTGPPGTFAGVEFGPGPPNFYDQPRLNF